MNPDPNARLAQAINRLSMRDEPLEETVAPDMPEVEQTIEKMYHLTSLEQEVYSALIGWGNNLTAEEIAGVLRKVADKVAPPQPLYSGYDEPPF